MKNFIEVEKTEQQQAEQIKKWIKENAVQIMIGIALGLGGILGFDYYQDYQQKQAIQARTHYLSIVANPSNVEALQTLKKDYANSTYTQHAELIVAKQSVANGKFKHALNYLLPLTNSTDEFIAQNAKFRAASVYLEINDTDKALDVLSENTNKAFGALYHHIKGDIYFAKNNIDIAKKHYNLALSLLETNSKLASIVKIKLNDLN